MRALPSGAARSLLRRQRWGALRSSRAGFSIYHTPQNSGDNTWVLDYQVKVNPWISRMHPAFDMLRQDRQHLISRNEFEELCPEALPEVVNILFNIFDTNPRDGKISYGEMCAFMLLAAGEVHAEEQLESLFLMCEAEGNAIAVNDLRQVISMLYYARFKDPEFVNFKVDKVLAETLGVPEVESAPEKITHEQYTEWARSDQVLVQEVRELLKSSIVDAHDDVPMETWTIQARRAFEKIKVENPVVELDGDEMTRIIWQMIKEKLIFPFLDMDIDYFDLSITYRDTTDDQVTVEATKSIREYHVGIKCPTITPKKEHVLEFNLSKFWPCSSEVIRERLRGTTFQAPVFMDSVPQYVPGWEKPIIIAKHSTLEPHKFSPVIPDQEGTLKVIFQTQNEDMAEGEVEELVHQRVKPSKAGGVVLGVYSKRDTVDVFAKCCFEHALNRELPLVLATSEGLLKEIDEMYVDAFDHLYQTHYKKVFDEKGLLYEHRRLDKTVAQAVQGNGGFVWATTESDGDAVSSLVMEGFGHRGLRLSTHVCPNGKTLLIEAGHGTVTQHYRNFQDGETPISNPVSCIVTWSRGLAQRAKLDKNPRLAEYARSLEEACTNVVAKGCMTKDLARRIHGPEVEDDKWVSTEHFVGAVADELRLLLCSPGSGSSPQSRPSPPASPE